MKRFIIWITVVLFAILTAIFTATPASASNGLKAVPSSNGLKAVPSSNGLKAVPLAAADWTHDLVIANDRRSVTSLRVCQNWSVSGTCASGIRYLPPGTNTKSRFGWYDADAIYVAKGYKVRSGRTYFRTVGWVKRGGRGGLTETFQVYRSNA